MTEEKLTVRYDAKTSLFREVNPFSLPEPRPYSGCTCIMNMRQPIRIDPNCPTHGMEQFKKKEQSLRSFKISNERKKVKSAKEILMRNSNIYLHDEEKFLEIVNAMEEYAAQEHPSQISEEEIEKLLDKLLIERGEEKSRVRNPVYMEERKLAKDLLKAANTKQYSEQNIDTVLKFTVWKDQNYEALGSPHYYYVGRFAELPKDQRHKYKLSELFQLFIESTKPPFQDGAEYQIEPRGGRFFIGDKELQEVKS